MKKHLILLLVSYSLFSQKNEAFKTPYEIGNKNQTTTYFDCIDFYQKLESNFATIKMIEKGKTDSGFPLHLVIFSNDNNFNLNQNKLKILINNGIHPGEPDGIDATMMLFRDLAIQKIKVPKNTIIIAIPVYNIGGMLNRNSSSRANQNGPEEYGFRGNARNFDLNRDFIKSDTKNSRTFQDLFTEIHPEIFIDNHVSNGADYQHTLTLIATQHERLGKENGSFFSSKMYPEIIKDLKEKNTHVVPYVNIHGDKPDDGYAQFADTPRYATGYSTLFNSFGFVVETHMLKPYDKRVASTYDFMVSVINYAEKNSEQIKTIKNNAINEFKVGNSYPINWKIDSSNVKMIDFKGFEGSYKKSDVTGKNRLFYDKNKPFSKKIKFYENHQPTKHITIPKAYVIPQSQWEIIDLLKLNHIQYTQLKNDSIIEIESYHIENYKTSKNPYEGHYFHYNTSVKSKKEKVSFLKGDYIFFTQQSGVKYLLETLEPEAVDSFFNWNFFDTILQQKEYFSAYVFEDLAKEILNNNPILNKEFEALKQENKNFNENPEQQLDWIYKHSNYYEKAHLKYPIFRIVN